MAIGLRWLRRGGTVGLEGMNEWYRDAPVAGWSVGEPVFTDVDERLAGVEELAAADFPDEQVVIAVGVDVAGEVAFEVSQDVGQDRGVGDRVGLHLEAEEGVFRGVGCFGELAEEYLVIFRKLAQCELPGFADEREYFSALGDGDADHRRCEGCLLNPTGEHACGSVFVARREDEQPRGNLPESNADIFPLRFIHNVFPRRTSLF